MEETTLVARLEAAAELLTQALDRLDAIDRTGQLAHLSATVEPGQREAELEDRLRAAERELADLRANTAQNVLTPLRRTLPAATTEMLAKHGIGEGPVDVRALDAALAGLSLEQRIAVKTQLLRAGAIA
jgi:multidrug efflux pump subunit AcrA (membrane-fusion protein)